MSLCTYVVKLSGGIDPGQSSNRAPSTITDRHNSATEQTNQSRAAVAISNSASRRAEICRRTESIRHQRSSSAPSAAMCNNGVTDNAYDGARAYRIMAIVVTREQLPVSCAMPSSMRLLYARVSRSALIGR